MAKTALFPDSEFETITREEELELIQSSERPKFELFPEPENFVSKYYNFMTQNQGPYPDYYVAGALNLLSIAANKRIYTPIEYGYLYSNLWTFELGISSMSHKTVAMNPTKILAHAIAPGCAWPGQFSAVGLFQRVAEVPRGYMLKDEAGTILHTINTNAEARNARDFFCELYENSRIDARVLAMKVTKKGAAIQNEWVIEDPYSTLSWATTPSTFQRNTTIADAISGFLVRFIYFNPNYYREVPPLGVMRDGFDAGFLKIKKDLEEISNKLIERKNTKLTMSFSARAMWQAWQKTTMKEITKERNELKGTVFQRMVTTPLKLAMAYTIGSEEFLQDKGNLSSIRDYEMLDDHVSLALKQSTEYFLPHTFDSIELVGTGTELKRIENVEAKLKQNGGSMVLRDLYRSLNCSRKEIIDIFDVGIDLRETLKIVKVDGVEKIIYTPK